MISEPRHIGRGKLCVSHCVIPGSCYFSALSLPLPLLLSLYLCHFFYFLFHLYILPPSTFPLSPTYSLVASLLFSVSFLSPSLSLFSPPPSSISLPPTLALEHDPCLSSLFSSLSHPFFVHSAPLSPSALFFTSLFFLFVFFVVFFSCCHSFVSSPPWCFLLPSVLTIPPLPPSLPHFPSTFISSFSHLTFFHFFLLTWSFTLSSSSFFAPRTPPLPPRV